LTWGRGRFRAAPSPARKGWAARGREPSSGHAEGSRRRSNRPGISQAKGPRGARHSGKRAGSPAPPKG
jgi:hypothetical protein